MVEAALFTNEYSMLIIQLAKRQRMTIKLTLEIIELLAVKPKHSQFLGVESFCSLGLRDTR